MREIKFRAWDKNSEEMVKVKTIDFDNDGLACVVDISDINLDKSECIVMQYTGLKDKNGVEIYEGDIVRHSKIADDISIIRFGEFGVPNIEEQEYQDVAFGFYFENASDLKDVAPFNMTVPMNKAYVKGIEVIGNIYENKELLEEKQ